MADISTPATLPPRGAGALPGAGAKPRRKARLSQRINMAAGIVSIPLFLVVWQLIAQARIVNPILFPAPTEVARAMMEWVSSGLFVENIIFREMRTSSRRRETQKSG